MADVTISGPAPAETAIVLTMSVMEAAYLGKFLQKNNVGLVCPYLRDAMYAELRDTMAQVASDLMVLDPWLNVSF